MHLILTLHTLLTAESEILDYEEGEGSVKPERQQNHH